MQRPKYHACSDCKKVFRKGELFRIRPPQDLGIPVMQPRSVFWMCHKCWERMIGNAMMTLIR